MQPAAPEEGDAVGFSATVHNVGTDSTPAGVVVRVAFAVNGTQVAWSDTSTLSLAPGASRTLTATGAWVALAGSSAVRAWVDGWSVAGCLRVARITSRVVHGSPRARI